MYTQNALAVKRRATGEGKRHPAALGSKTKKKRKEAHLDKRRRKDAHFLGLHAVYIPFQPLGVKYLRQDQHGVRHERQLIWVLRVVVVVKRDPVWPRRNLSWVSVGGDVLSSIDRSASLLQVAAHMAPTPRKRQIAKKGGRRGREREEKDPERRSGGQACDSDRTHGEGGGRGLHLAIDPVFCCHPRNGIGHRYPTSVNILYDLCCGDMGGEGVKNRRKEEREKEKKERKKTGIQEKTWGLEGHWK